jgi:hypothetical protein
MARKIIDTGIVGNDGTGDSIRDSFRKVNDNFRELYGALGLGTRLSFLSLDETPDSFSGEENAVVAVNPTETAMMFKQIVGGDNIAIDFVSNENEIKINNLYTISSDPAPRLGGPFSARSGAVQYRINDLPPYPLLGADIGGPKSADEAVSKAYADSKVSRAGVDSIDPITNTRNSSFGVMTGPLILSRNPVPEDDIQYDGLIAATKSYVDNAGFGSIINLYVATSGDDARVGVGEELQGRALSYAYKTLEAALRRAEEIVRSAQPEIGPYRKLLTWTDPLTRVTTNSVLSGIDISPDSGSGYAGDPLMSIDTIEIGTSVGIPQSGFDYQVGDLVFINPPTEIAGVTQPSTLEVLSVNSLPGTPNGPILTFRLLTGGVFLDIPGANLVTSTTNSAFGQQARFNVTYRVNNIRTRIDPLTDQPLVGSGYSLVSVRLTPQPGDTGSGAFGFADVANGSIASITITDGGRNFRAVPSLDVNLPRFRIFTGGYRTDFTGDVTTETDAARRTRDIREGLYLEGVESRALAQILAHDGSLDSDGNELFDVDIKFGAFIPGEEIAYGDVATKIQISINVESGFYEENFPLKVPANVSIVGDEFRRCIIRPRPGPSSSPWAFTYFKRDRVIDTLPTSRNEYNRALTDPFGYHYLSEADKPVYPLVDNKGFYRAAAALLRLNKTFIQEEVIAWISEQIRTETIPFDNPLFTYNESLCKRDVGLIVEAMAFDLLYGGNDRTVSAALKYRDNESGRIAITDQLSQTSAAIRRLNTVAQMVIKNLPIFRFSEFPQIIDLAFVAEAGTGGIPLEIIAITNAIIIEIQTVAAHGFADGEIVTFHNVGGMTELNGQSYFVKVVDATRFNLHLDSTLNTPVDSRFYGEFTTGGSVVPSGGVVGALTDAILDIISDSNAVNYPLDNDQMDVFLMNDATILRALTIQGHGGFAMVLDPAGQVLAKSPYAQEGAVFSKSTGRQTFAGGMFVDGFTGNIRFKLLDKISNTRLIVGDLQRFPQLPASFIVEDNVYRINYVRDFEFDTQGSTAIFVLDETTPWPFPVFSYNEAACSRDVGLIITGLGFDLVFGSNYHARKAGLTYRQANAAVVIENQLGITVRAINYAHELAKDEIRSLTPPFGQNYGGVIDSIESSRFIITNIIRRGGTAAPTLVLPNPPGLPSAKANAKALLISNINFIKDEVAAFMQATYPAVSFEIARSKRDTEFVVNSVIYDLIYGGNSQSVDAGLKYWDGILDAITPQLDPSQNPVCAAGIDYARLLAQNVIQNIPFPGTIYTSTPQVFDPSNPSDLGTANEIEALFDIVKDIIANGVSSTPAIVFPNLGTYSYDTLGLNSRVALNAKVAEIQTKTIDFVDEIADVYEVLMPGNRSMLSNDFTQICDMGYGLIATNGGLTEAVSMFTYYNYISYYSINGGQIRSVAGSSAHGNYALVAEGSDPLEVPTPVDCYYEFSQGATVFNDGGFYNNVASQFTIYVGDYDYPPRDFSEIEIDHGGLLGMVRYPVISAVTEDGFPVRNGKPIYRLNISADGDGLADEVNDLTKVTLRINTEIVLTGGVVGVATRPSTALILNESRGFAGATTDIQNLYRILQFSDYIPPPEETQQCTIQSGPETLISTLTPHNQLPGYQIFFTPQEDDSSILPAGLFANEAYYVLDDGFTETSFKISAAKDGVPLATTSAGNGEFFFTPTRLAETILREGYDYVEATIFPRQPFRDYGTNLIVGPTKLLNGVSYRILTVGVPGSISDFTLVGAADNNPGTVFTASGPITASLVLTSSITSVIGTGQVFAEDSLCTFDDPTDTVNKTAHGFNNGDVVRFETTGSMPVGLFTTRQYFVYNAGPNDFQLVGYPGSTDVITFTGAGSGLTGVGTVIGISGDSAFAVVPIGTNDRRRINGMKFNFKGENYTVTQYETEGQTGEIFARFNISPPLQDSVLDFVSSVTLKCAVPARTEGSQGTLTIRISLTRVTGHDLLEIGTGSYADTNYPNEIYGPPVRIATDTLLDITGELDYAQVVERGEGRCFFVTTDQFGNFSVGPYFRVDQGTGTVTFAASIALSNLDGLGFKRGVPVSEFSTDSAFADNATDTVPTENATRTYIDRRLGVSHEGFNVEDERLIPPGTGGFLAVNGQNPMKSNLNMGSTTVTRNRITNLADPINPEDAVNFRSLTVANLQDFDLQAAKAASVFTFTGDGTTAIPANIDGDIFVPEDGITTGLDSTLNQLNIYIKPGIIDNADINPSAAIDQSKLNMKAADTSAAAPSPADQSVLGLARFKNTEFTATNGWVELQTATSDTTGVLLEKIRHLPTDTVVGRSAAGTGAASAVTFATVIDEGFAVKKNQYSATGFLRRSGTTNTLDTDYVIVDMASGYVGTVDTAANGRLVVRSSDGDFGGRRITASVQYNIGTRKITDLTTTATGGSTVFYGFGVSGVQQSGLSIGDGSLGTDKLNTYQNDNHLFRNYANSAFAPITVSQITASTVTTGGASTAGTLTGNWTLSTTSNITFGTGILDIQNGTLKSRTLTTGDSSTTGTVTGNWSLTASSIINADLGTLRSTTLSTGAAGTAGTITGNWSLGSGSQINASSGTLRSTTLTTGAAGTAGTITGDWSLATTSNLTLGTGTINASTGTLRSTTLTTGASGTAGSITGTWSLSASSVFNADAGTLRSTTLSTGAAGTAGTITGNWSMATTSNLTFGTGILDVTTGTLRTRTLNTGATGTTGTVEGTWTVGAGSSFTATNATTAGSATNSTNSTNVGVTDTTTTNSTFYPTFVDGTSGNRAIRVDSSTFTFNPSNNTLTTGTFAGNLSGTTAQVTTLTTGSSGTSGTVTGNWSLSSGSRFQATYADLAEYYEGDADYEVGTVMIFGGDKEVTVSTQRADSRVAGVVSDSGAYIMNQGCQGIKICIALQGRVPCRVIGKIRKGDILVTSDIRGVAVAEDKELRVGTVIGKALQDYDSDQIGTIEVAVGRT